MKRFILLSLAVFCLASCRKFLEERSQSELTPETTSDFNELLYGDGYPLSDVYLQPQLRMMDDDMQCYNTRVNQQSNIVTRANRGAYTWQPHFIEVCREEGSSDMTRFNSWKSYYGLILGCNVALQHADESIGSEADKHYLKGQAYALRAFYHFMLVNLYALPYNYPGATPDQHPGIPLKLDANLYEELPVRGTVKAVYAQVSRDIDSAIHLLEKEKVVKGQYRVNYIVAHHLAARVYLFMENWDKVIEHTNVVLSLHPQLRDLNTWVDDGVIHMLSVSNPEVIWAFGHVNENLPVGAGETYSVSQELFAMFAANDLRNPNYLLEFPDVFKPFFSIPYSSRKLLDKVQKNERGTVWRSAEAYLNRAEAYLQKYRQHGNMADAQKGLDDLNRLGAHRYKTFQPWGMAPADSLLQLCRNERRRELFHEEAHRWFDLRRYGMPAITHYYRADAAGSIQAYTLEARDPQYTLPIPVDVTERNPALQQNNQLGAARQPF